MGKRECTVYLFCMMCSCRPIRVSAARSFASTSLSNVHLIINRKIYYNKLSLHRAASFILCQARLKGIGCSSPIHLVQWLCLDLNSMDSDVDTGWCMKTVPKMIRLVLSAQAMHSENLVSYRIFGTSMVIKH